MKKPSRNRGFSLIEIMIALGVIAISLFSVLAVIAHTNTEKEYQRQLTIAKEGVEKKLDELKGQAWTTLSTGIAPKTTDTIITSTTSIFTPFSIEGLAYPSFLNDKKGQGTCKIIFARPDPAAPANVSMIDLEVRVEWQGVNGPDGKDSITKKPVSKLSSYSMRTLLIR